MIMKMMKMKIIKKNNKMMMMNLMVLIQMIYLIQKKNWEYNIMKKNFNKERKDYLNYYKMLMKEIKKQFWMQLENQNNKNDYIIIFMGKSFTWITATITSAFCWACADTAFDVILESTDTELPLKK